MVKKKSRKLTKTELTAMMLVLVGLSVVLMVLDAKSRVTPLRDGIQIALVMPIKNASTWPSRLTHSINEYLTSKADISDENAELKREIAWLKASLANQTVLEAENRRLKRLLESSANYNHPVQVAEVIDSFIDANKHQIEISKGKRDEIIPGQVVIDENGLVGQVTNVYENTATITLLSDVRQRIPVFIERNRLRMIARGTGDLNEIELAFVSKDADIRVGDKLVTSGLGERYPRGYGIATVTHVQTNPISEFTDVRAKPLAALDRVLEVLLIAPKAGIEETLADETSNANEPLSDSRGQDTPETPEGTIENNELSDSDSINKAETAGTENSSDAVENEISQPSGDDNQ